MATKEPKTAVFGHINLWEYLDTDGIKDSLGISNEDWDYYDIQFKNVSKSKLFTDVAVVGIE